MDDRFEKPGKKHQPGRDDTIIGSDDLVLITGAAGFIGSKVVETLLSYGFRNLRCFVRPSSNVGNLRKVVAESNGYAQLDLIEGNLLSRDDCKKAADGVSVIYNLVAGMERTFPGAYMNSVITLRNLLESIPQANCFKRFLHVSSFAVYSNLAIKRGGLLDETCQIESRFMERSEAYCFGKVRQDELLMEYGHTHNIPYVIVRPGIPYGPGVKAPIHARIGINPFGPFFHLGGSNRIPFTYIDNCAEAIVLSGLKQGIDGKIFNVVDDNLPTSRQFLRLYKKNVRRFRSIYVPYRVFYLFSYLWEKYSISSEEQLPPAFNRRKCAALWKGNEYSNRELKDLVGWKPTVPLEEGMNRTFDYLKRVGGSK